MKLTVSEMFHKNVRNNYGGEVNVNVDTDTDVSVDTVDGSSKVSSAGTIIINLFCS
jgi:hypothetical protein